MEMDACTAAGFRYVFLRLCPPRPRVRQVRNEKCIYCEIKIFISKLKALSVVWIYPQCRIHCKLHDEIPGRSQSPKKPNASWPAH